jgi:hypothetical protein
MVLGAPTGKTILHQLLELTFTHHRHPLVGDILKPHCLLILLLFLSRDLYSAQLLCCSNRDDRDLYTHVDDD